jgi:DNA-binding transcriptional MerR regulator
MKRINKKYDPLYLPLKEVCKILNVKPHIIDYWEKRFPEIKPYKIGKRNFYKKEQLELLLQLKKLLDEGYSLEGARKRIFQPKREIKKEEAYTPSLFPNLEIPEGNLSKPHHDAPKKEEQYFKTLLKDLLKELKDIYSSL